jgi:hypothetical protein
MIDFKFLDPRGLIQESYKIDGVSAPECRSIFLDWALGMPGGVAMQRYIKPLIDHYGQSHEDHPMTQTLRDGLKTATATGRRGGRASRVAE